MTDRFHSLTVVLDKDMRDDDAENIIKAICCLRGVISVSGHVADITSRMAEDRARHVLGEKIIELLYPKVK